MSASPQSWTLLSLSSFDEEERRSSVIRPKLRGLAYSPLLVAEFESSHGRSPSEVGERLRRVNGFEEVFRIR